MPKGTSRAEVMLNSEKTKPVAIAVIELRLTENIRQSVSHKKILLNKIFLKFHGNFFESISGRSESLFGLSFT